MNTAAANNDAWCATPWAQTYSGAKVWLGSDDEPANFDALDPFDLPAMLAQVARWGGATRKPVTLAQHSMIVCSFAGELGGDAQTCLYALLHDAHEIILGDTTSPGKAAMSAVAKFEHALYQQRLDRAIFQTYGLPGMMDDETARIVKLADIRAGLWEARDALNAPPIDDWTAAIADKYGLQAPPARLHVLDWQDAAFAFYRVQAALMRKLGGTWDDRKRANFREDRAEWDRAIGRPFNAEAVRGRPR